MLRVSIIGASGYTGVELIRLLSAHPQVKLSKLISETYAGQSLAQVFPQLAPLSDYVFSKLQLEELIAASDVVCLALPHGKAPQLASALVAAGIKVIDLSADLRLNDGKVYQQWYQEPAASPELLQLAVYGLAEIGYREQIASCQVVANPGCYPTATLLGLAPLLAAQVLDLTAYPIIIDAKSGVSGAGRSLNLASHFCEVTSGFSAYQLAGRHRHTPEISQELAKLNQGAVSLQFTPHLVPMVRGLMATIYAKVQDGIHEDDLTSIYHDYYANSYFVKYLAQARPSTKAVHGSNFCHLTCGLDSSTRLVTVVSCIDNLLKGAAGQAVQNLNIMHGFTEELGLTQLPCYP